jgi:hypothetical protein
MTGWLAGGRAGVLQYLSEVNIQLESFGWSGIWNGERAKLRIFQSLLWRSGAGRGLHSNWPLQCLNKGPHSVDIRKWDRLRVGVGTHTSGTRAILIEVFRGIYQFLRANSERAFQLGYGSFLADAFQFIIHQYT